MTNQKTYLGKIKNTEPLKDVDASLLHAKLAKPLKINFDDGQSALLDISQPRPAIWAKMMGQLQQDGRPTYVEVDPATGIITTFCIPIATKVLEIFPADVGAVKVALHGSDAMHSLHPSTPGFQQFYDLLQQARNTDSKIMVTATPHDFDIIDVRALTPLLRDEEPDEDTDEPLPPPVPIVPVSAARATELFNLTSATTCTTESLASPCITFKYPGSGCNVRAHLMCRLMIAQGATPEKIWIWSGLVACTPNAPKCEVGWAWHVAPTLMVEQSDRPPIKMVLDPSLCDHPVTVDYWKSLMGNKRANLHADRWELYEYPAHGTASAKKAEREMQQLRGWLADAWALNPPPYNCPPCKK